MSWSIAIISFNYPIKLTLLYRVYDQFIMIEVIKRILG